MDRSTPGLVPPRENVTGGFSHGTELISSIVAGLLIGILLDWILGISPWMVIVWSIAGATTGFIRLWHASASLETEGRERSHGA